MIKLIVAVMVGVFIYSVGHAQDIVAHQHDNAGTEIVYTIYNVNRLVIVETAHFVHSIFSHNGGDITLHMDKVNPTIDAMRNANHD